MKLNMKNLYIKAIAALLIGGSMASCGDKFLETDMYKNVDLDTGLSTVSSIGNALNGTYYRLFQYYFAGNFATMTGDLASDIAYWNGRTSHQDAIYRFAYTDTDISLKYVWEYGYKVADHSSRVIEAANHIYAAASDEEKAELSLYKAEAFALRAYSHFVLVNIFGHQVKVNGNDFSSKPGIVIVDAPIAAFTQVQRSTVGETYAAILADLKNALTEFDKAGGDQGDLFYFNKASVYGLMARVNLYLENYGDAITCAQDAIDESGITTLTYEADAYKALYNGGASNKESIFALAIDATNNWSANSCGTLWSTYDYSPSPYLLSLYSPNDVRLSIMGFNDEESTPAVPVFAGGKFASYGSGNPADATNYLINAPEMFLIKAESYLKKDNDVTNAKDALLVVAKRNKDITTVNDLPADKDGLMKFIKEERARELFQEGQRLYDLRRWDERANVYAIGAPEIKYTYTGYKISDMVFPIPVDEINTGFGVSQNSDWRAGRPTK